LEPLICSVSQSCFPLLPSLQLLADPYLLAKFKNGIADKRARQNNFTRTLADVSRTMRDLGLHHVVQARRARWGDHPGGCWCRSLSTRGVLRLLIK
jgi:hypothetical protein